MGIEPTTSAWEADVLPLNYTCINPIVPRNSLIVKGKQVLLFLLFLPSDLNAIDYTDYSIGDQ